ncbi:hypothetical protein PoB_005304700 [Plakobranchus ocellatus]|uniref:Uncharacterized protein n=1 Tax=Plakobranchus ocellatus TaxID=259542 RepID=A0AAV4C594_9GAST|nr:hypothetical protein PoB_005304700 [Plakobranchus ocellatus]
MDALEAITNISQAKRQFGYYLLEKNVSVGAYEMLIVFSGRYEALQSGPTEKKKKQLMKSRSTRQESPLYYVSIEETFDVIRSANISTDRGGIDLMLKEL